MQIRFFPFFVVKRFNIPNKFLEKLTDREIIDFIFRKLEKEEFERLELKEMTIEIKGDHAGLGFNFDKMRDATQLIDFGSISIFHHKKGRQLVYKYQLTMFTITSLIFGILFGVITMCIWLGVICFIFLFVSSWLWVYIIQIMTVSGYIDQLIYDEHWKNNEKKY
jgi:hypothetical protein